MFSLLQHILATPTPTSLYTVPIATIPPYVIDYAPLVWLQSTEKYNPGDIGAQLVNTKPETNFTVVSNAPNPLTLNNLNELDSNVYLTSIEDVTTNPSWLNGVEPDSTGKTEGASSCAIIVNDHGSGLVDAFYMYFYPFNLGNTVLGDVIGNHVGDWEHNMIRYKDGVPQALWYSQHGFGEAFTYAAVEKRGIRPVTYSAAGSHANYAVNGTHDHTIPNLDLPFPLLLVDYTDQGRLWDPAVSAYTFSYNASTGVFKAYEASTPTDWLYFTGAWGDQQYPLSDPRQKELFGISLTAKWQSGPRGPYDKQLNRTEVCPVQEGYVCVVKDVKTSK